MNNLPIKKEIEKLLERVKPGKEVFRIRGRKSYLKLTSGGYCPLEISLKCYEHSKDALKDMINCAKVYTKFIELGVYHPKTMVAVYKNEDKLALLLVMPELEPGKELFWSYNKQMKIASLGRRLGLAKMLSEDIYMKNNWGYDRKRKRWYFYDLHPLKKDHLYYPSFLEAADKLGIK